MCNVMEVAVGVNGSAVSAADHTALSSPHEDVSITLGLDISIQR